MANNKILVSVDVQVEQAKVRLTDLQKALAEIAATDPFAQFKRESLTPLIAQYEAAIENLLKLQDRLSQPRKTAGTAADMPFGLTDVSAGFTQQFEFAVREQKKLQSEVDAAHAKALQFEKERTAEAQRRAAEQSAEDKRLEAEAIKRNKAQEAEDKRLEAEAIKRNKAQQAEDKRREAETIKRVKLEEVAAAALAAKAAQRQKQQDREAAQFAKAQLAENKRVWGIEDQRLAKIERAQVRATIQDMRREKALDAAAMKSIEAQINAAAKAREIEMTAIARRNAENEKEDKRREAEIIKRAKLERAKMDELHAQALLDDKQRNAAMGMSEQRRIPYFLQFAFFPFADLARTFGAPGVAQGLMAAGSIFGIVDQLGPMADGFRLLSQDLQKMGNIIGPVATRIATATAGFGTLGSAIATVGLVAAPAAAALIGVVAVIAEIQRRAEEAAKAGRDLAAREINVANIIASGATTQEVTQQRDEAQNLLNLTNQQTSGLAVLQIAMQNALDAQSEAIANFAGVADAINSAALDAAQQRVTDLIDEIVAYTGVQVDQTTVMSFLNAAVEEANTSLTQMETDVQAYNIALASGALAANDARAAQEEAIKAAEEFGQALREDVAEVLNAVREEQTRRNQSYLDAVEASVKAQEELIKAQNDAAEAAQEHSDKVRAIQEDYAEKARDAEKKLADNRQKIAEDNAKAIAKIEREFSRSYADAIANRDAVAAAKAIQRRDDELADLEEARQEQQKALSRAYEDALQAAREAQAKALRQEQERYAKELTTVQRAQQLALVAVQNAKNAEVAIYQNRMLSIVGIAGIGLNTVQLQFSRMFASIIMMADRTAQLIPQLMARYQYGQYRAGERGSYGMSVQQIVDQRMMQIFGGGQLGGGGAGFYVRTR